MPLGKSETTVQLDEDAVLVRLSCYEPAGYELAWTERDILQHVLMIGMTGSGKTSQLRRIIHQLIAYRANEPEERVGLCIVDAKVDDTVAMVKSMAAEAKRHSDVIVLGPNGDHTLQLFSSLRSLADVDRMARWLCFGSKSMGRENAFWNEYRHAMLDAALTLLVVYRLPVEYGEAMEFLRHLFFLDLHQGNLAKRILAHAKDALNWLPTATRRKVGQALEVTANWRTMDSRTKSSVQATLMNAIRPLVSVSASRCFESHGQPDFNMEKVLNEGCISIVSVNALAEPDLASLVFKLVKAQYFQTVQVRGSEPRRLCGFVADEWPLVVTPDDAENLATIRSKRSCFIAAAQGLSSLDEQSRVRRCLIANFGSLLLFRTREDEVDAMAMTHFGSSLRDIQFPGDAEFNDLLVSNRKPIRFYESVPICPPGTLGRLLPHQAFVSLPEAGPHPVPVWLVPAHEEPSTPVPERTETPKQDLQDAASAASLMRLMKMHGARICLRREVLLALLSIKTDAGERDFYMKKVHSFFSSQSPLGLESLPVSWLKAIPGILQSLSRRWHGRVPLRFRRLSFSEGMLLMEFNDDAMNSFMADQVRTSMNRSLYPSYWRRLRHELARKLSIERPDLVPLIMQSSSFEFHTRPE